MKEFFALSLIRFRSLRCPSSFLGCKDYYHYEQDNSENDQQQAYLQRRGERECVAKWDWRRWKILFLKKEEDQDSVAEASWNYQWRVWLLSFSSFWKLAFCLWSCNNCILYMGVNVICSKIRETELDGKIGRPALNILKCRYLICQPNRLHTNHRSLVVD